MASWFADNFGFDELSFSETRARFACETIAGGDDSFVLKSRANRRAFHVGRFSTPSVAELRADMLAGSAVGVGGGGGITFTNIAGNARSLHLDSRNAGAVFQVASQFNLLEMVGPGVRPQDGITRYASDKTQGPACAMACPAGTVFRNYFINGVGQGHVQFDGAGDLAKLVQNDKHGYWTMQNGYMLPTRMGVLNGLNKRMESEVLNFADDANGDDDSRSGAGEAKSSSASSGTLPLREAMVASLRVGIHWDTEVERPRRNPECTPHRVCQVYSSAVPVNYTKTKATSKQWEPLARAILEGTYEATLSAAALLSLQRGGERVTVFLTSVGGGAFGNRTEWIADAMEAAIRRFQAFSLDVKLVHYMRNVTERTNPFVKLALKFRKQNSQNTNQKGSASSTPAPTAVAEKGEK